MKDALNSITSLKDEKTLKKITKAGKRRLLRISAFLLGGAWTFGAVYRGWLWTGSLLALGWLLGPMLLMIVFEGAKRQLKEMEEAP